MNSLTDHEMDGNTTIINLREYYSMSLKALINIKFTIKLKNSTSIETAISHIIEVFNYQNDQSKHTNAVNHRSPSARITTIPNDQNKFQNTTLYQTQYPNFQMQSFFNRNAPPNL